ncbi:MAG: hypothetical protein WDN49_09695 [Acetobacteraceae bacterium]
MARERLLIELDEVAVRNLNELMAIFHESQPSDMIATALGVMGTLSDFVEDGVLTVIDPAAPTDDPEEREVDLVFRR